MHGENHQFSNHGCTARQRAGLLALAVVLLSAAPRTAHAHLGGTYAGGEWWSVWNWDPVILLNLVLLSWLYGRGLERMWQKAGRGYGVSGRHAAAFGGAIAALFVALISPLDPLSEELSWVHMVQHMVLMMIAAPLFVLGAPALVLMWGLPRPWRQDVGRWRRRFDAWHSPWYLLWQPVLLWALYALILWIWHLPALYHAALRDPLIHDLQHLTFFVASCLFWRVLFDPIARLRLSPGVGVLYLFTTSLHASVLGVFMALSPRPWYSDYEGRTAAWNLTPLEDQQLAGLIMWMPACMIYAVAAAALFALWIRELPGAGVQRSSGAGNAAVPCHPAETKTRRHS